MSMKTASPNYQAIARHFSVGDRVYSFGSSKDHAGVVLEVYPGIGMVDVEYASGTLRRPVEELVRLDDQFNPDPVSTGYQPGGEGSGMGKTALYWAAVDRRYRATKNEKSSSKFICPHCKKEALTKAIYRRLEGKSERLYGCKSCLFLIERDKILGLD